MPAAIVGSGDRCGATGRLILALALLGACAPPPGVRVRATREVGVIGQSDRVVGRDGGYGARLWDRQVFLFGDTFVRIPDADGSSFHSNTFAFTADLDATDGIEPLADPVDAAGSPLPALAPTADERRFNLAHLGDPCAEPPCGARFATWPGAAVWDPARERAIVSYALLETEPGPWNFRGRGQSFALWGGLDSQAERPEVAGRPCPDHPTLLFCRGEPAWGAALVPEGELLYAFACEADGELGKPCRLARVPTAEVLDRSRWAARDGSAWNRDLRSARTLFHGAPILRVFFDDHAGAWVAAYSGVLTNEVHFRTAPALTGPWSAEARLFVADRRGGPDWTYDALVQPDYSAEGGRILHVTYTRPTGPFASELVLQRVELD